MNKKDSLKKIISKDIQFICTIIFLAFEIFIELIKNYN